MSEPRFSPTGDPDEAVALRAVVKEYDRGLVRALDGAQLTVRRGEWVAVMGPSGCGKSTLLHLLAALERPTSGAVRVFGQDLVATRDLASYRRRRVGLVFQLHDLLPQLTAAQNVEVAMFGTGASRAQRRARARQLLADVDLAGREHRAPATLSGGERQRVAIARALANDPPLLLADEPTGSLDSASVRRVIALVERLRSSSGLTVVMVTHDPDVAAEADRIVRMSDGRMIRPVEQPA